MIKLPISSSIRKDIEDEHYINMLGPDYDLRGKLISLKESFHKSRLEYQMLASIEKNLEDLLIGDPIKINQICNTVKTIELKIPDERRMEVLWQLQSQIFNYDKFSKKQNGNIYDLYTLSAKIPIDVCPYCNRQFTSTIIVKSQKIVRADYDHFLDKATYPYASLSLYNLIPSCTICNSRLKGTAVFSINTHINPHIDDGNNIFSFFLRPTHTFGHMFSGSNSQVLVDTKKLATASNIDYTRSLKNLEDFEIKNLYEHHMDFLNDLLRKVYLYQDPQFQVAIQLLGKLIGTSKVSLVTLLFGNILDDQLHKSPLSKVTKDTLKQYGILP